jgi:hypothetical protein
MSPVGIPIRRRNESYSNVEIMGRIGNNFYSSTCVGSNLNGNTKVVCPRNVILITLLLWVYNVWSTAHQTIHFELCTAHITREFDRRLVQWYVFQTTKPEVPGSNSGIEQGLL